MIDSVARPLRGRSRGGGLSPPAPQCLAPRESLRACCAREGAGLQGRLGYRPDGLDTGPSPLALGAFCVLSQGAGAAVGPRRREPSRPRTVAKPCPEHVCVLLPQMCATAFRGLSLACDSVILYQNRPRLHGSKFLSHPYTPRTQEPPEKHAEPNFSPKACSRKSSLEASANLSPEGSFNRVRPTYLPLPMHGPFLRALVFAGRLLMSPT